jgi:hypothetical protein
VSLRDSLDESGELTLDMELSSVLHSLDIVQLTMETEEMGIEPTVPIKTVGDLLWLLKAIDFKLQRKKYHGPNSREAQGEYSDKLLARKQLFPQHSGKANETAG